jgi:hypothetical protein
MSVHKSLTREARKVQPKGGAKTAATLARGGCQCGKVRYRITGPVYNRQICHCRMCQKAFGSYFAPLAAVATTDIAWDNERPALFSSSAAALRGFCRHCGTPLTFQYISEPHEISIALGSLDDPAPFAPEVQYGIESRMPWFDGLAGLPGQTTDASTPDALLREIAQPAPDDDAIG